MIKPTVGRVVWFTPASNSAESGFSGYGGQPMAGTVAYVWNDRMVNLHVIDHVGVAHSKTSVPLVQDEEPKPDGYYCEWMPFQKGQAAKTEQLASAIASGQPDKLADER